MNREPKQHAWGTDKKIHHCPRHHDLTNLLKQAKAPICNSCFAILKKTHFNVVAGLLIEALYGRNTTTSHLERLNHLQKSINDHEEALLNLQAELTELKKGRRADEKPTPQTDDQLRRDLLLSAKVHKEQGSTEASPNGHVSQARKELAQLPQAQIDHFRAVRLSKNADTCPKTDDLQDRGMTVPQDNTKSTQQIVQELQDKEGND